MKEHLQDSIDMFLRLEGEEITETVTSSVQHNLREVNDECEKLSG